jgi:hypothetical protein
MVEQHAADTLQPFLGWRNEQCWVFHPTATSLL